MKNHWDKYLKVKDLVMKYKPDCVVELGAGSGENTRQYLKLRKKMPFEFITISDGDCPPEFEDLPRFWTKGISYIELPDFADSSIDFCSIDTDHNYWTLWKELQCLSTKMRKGGIVVMHDTECFSKTSGISDGGYCCDVPYPNEIRKYKDRPMTDALYEWVDMGVYKIIKQVKESCGATAIQKL